MSDDTRGGAPPDLRILPLTPERWPDLERLFGERGATGGCWCMWWRIPRAEFERRKGEENRRAFRGIIEGGAVPGLLAYDGDEPVGWCAVEPRDAYPVLDRSRTLRRLDDRPVWSVTCFFVARAYRDRGLTVRLLEAAKAHVRERGGTLLEGYPVAPRTERMPTVFAWTGFVGAFERAGFRECARRSETRPIVRVELGPAANPDAAHIPEKETR